MGALTGTADKTTQETIRKVLCMRPVCSTVYVSPNRLNLRFSVKKVAKEAQLKELKWIVNLITEEGTLQAEPYALYREQTEIKEALLAG